MASRIEVLQATARGLAEHGNSSEAVAVGRLLLQTFEFEGDPMRRAEETLDRIEDLVDALRRNLDIEPGAGRRTLVRGLCHVPGRGLVVLVNRDFGARVRRGFFVKISRRAETMVTEVNIPQDPGDFAGLFLRDATTEEVRIGDILTACETLPLAID
jgi:hypothetical protein